MFCAMDQGVLEGPWRGWLSRHCHFPYCPTPPSSPLPLSLLSSLANSKIFFIAVVGLVQSNQCCITLLSCNTAVLPPLYRATLHRVFWEANVINLKVSSVEMGDKNSFGHCQITLNSLPPKKKYSVKFQT